MSKIEKSIEFRRKAYDTKRVLRLSKQLPKRVDNCRVVPISNIVSLSKMVKGTHTFTQLQNCGNVHVCPHCRSKIMTKRKEETAELDKVLKKKGFKSFMVTLTLPHYSCDDAVEISKNLRDSWRNMVMHRQYKKLKKMYNIHGYVKSFEMTYSEENGFHPHLHVIYYIPENQYIGFGGKRFFVLWQRSVEKVMGRKVSLKGYDYTEDVENEGYGMKTLYDELSDNGKSEGRTYTFFRYVYENRQNLDNKVIKTYYEAMRGSNVRVFSRIQDPVSLNMMTIYKYYVGVEEEKDGDIVNDTLEIEKDVVGIMKNVWYAIKGKDLQLVVLDTIDMHKPLCYIEYYDYIVQILDFYGISFEEGDLFDLEEYQNSS